MSKPPNPDNPSSEPEIIPPGQAERGTERVRVYVAKPSPLGLILMTLIVGLLSAAILALLLVDVSLAVAFSRPGRDRRDRCRTSAFLFS
jgi:hypothetical protein